MQILADKAKRWTAVRQSAVDSYESKIKNHKTLKVIDEPSGTGHILEGHVGTADGKPIDHVTFEGHKVILRLLSACIPQGVSREKLKPTYATVIENAKKALEYDIPAFKLCRNRAISNRIIEVFLAEIGSSGKHSYFKELQDELVTEEEQEARKAQMSGKKGKVARVESSEETEESSPVEVVS